MYCTICASYEWLGRGSHADHLVHTDLLGNRREVLGPEFRNHRLGDGLGREVLDRCGAVEDGLAPGLQPRVMALLKVARDHGHTVDIGATAHRETLADGLGLFRRSCGHGRTHDGLRGFHSHSHNGRSSDDCRFGFLGGVGATGFPTLAGGGALHSAGHDNFLYVVDLVGLFAPISLNHPRPGFVKSPLGFPFGWFRFTN